MARYDVAMWLHSEKSWPDIILVVQAETAIDAVIAVLHARRVRHAVKVAVNAGDGFIHRWYGVTTLVESFDYERAVWLPMGCPAEQQPLAGSGGGITYES
ncbi:MAG: hypothetical protein ACYDB3_09825, partial [Acidimicrobiales bacterium]